MMILDTDFLIDLQRELIRDQPGPASQFLSEQADEQFAISVVTMLEFLEGYANARDGEDFLEPFVKLGADQAVARIGGRIRRSLRQQGTPIGDFDVLIAATALASDADLVTSNPRHFKRVPDLRIRTYRKPTP